MEGSETKGRKVALPCWDCRSSSTCQSLWSHNNSTISIFSVFLGKKFPTVCDGLTARAVCRWVLTFLMLLLVRLRWCDRSWWWQYQRSSRARALVHISSSSFLLWFIGTGNLARRGGGGQIASSSARLATLYRPKRQHSSVAINAVSRPLLIAWAGF